MVLYSGPDMSMSESKSRSQKQNTILCELHPALITFCKEELDSLKHLMKTSLVVTEAICKIRIEEIKLETKTRKTLIYIYKLKINIRETSIMRD